MPNIHSDDSGPSNQNFRSLYDLRNIKVHCGRAINPRKFQVQEIGDIRSICASGVV